MRKWFFLITVFAIVTVIATFVCKSNVSIHATEVLEMETTEDKNVMKEAGDTAGATFHIKLNVSENFTDEVQLLFYSLDSEYEYECVLTIENQYTASFFLEGNQTYKLMYYYKSYEVYEIEAIPETFKCESGTPWDLELNVVGRTVPVEKSLYPLFGDMTEEELKEIQVFYSDAFPNMTEEEVFSWFYGKLKNIENESKGDAENAGKSALESLANSIKNETTEGKFRYSSGTTKEWENLTDIQVIAFYYSSVLPEIIIENNDFDYNVYISNLKLFEKSCANVGQTNIYETTYQLWNYIWEYQKSQKQFPNFATYCITEFREEWNVQKNIDEKLDTSPSIPESDKLGSDDNKNGIGNMVAGYLKEHITSFLLLIMGSCIFIYFIDKEKKGKKGIWKK